MVQGLHGKRVAQHLGLSTSTSLALNPSSGRSLVLTRLQAPDGLAGPSRKIAPEPAHILSVDLTRPGIVKGWGNWTEGCFKPVSYWDLGGIDILDLRSDPVLIRSSSFEVVHIYIPDSTLQSHADEAGLDGVPALYAEPGRRDDVLLRWTRALLPFFGDKYLLPGLALEELVSMFCSYLLSTYAKPGEAKSSAAGGLCFWQKRRASRMIHERIAEEITLGELAAECRLSPSHFARAFKRTFGVPAHQYLIQQRVEMSKSLLLHSNLSLLSIALECGFADQSAFSRSFRSIVKTSPGAWQREQRSMPRNKVFVEERGLASVPSI